MTQTDSNTERRDAENEELKVKHTQRSGIAEPPPGSIMLQSRRSDITVTAPVRSVSGSSPQPPDDRLTSDFLSHFKSVSDQKGSAAGSEPENWF